ncbi:MaoC family dehydratase [Cryptosporangium sp. NPDC051539]|uniref:MaoC family dehydratase n=1 Tax=Cryptosporangium sp. NPDC051539 TaxID=3363962 RepID=UPI0037A8F7F4
MITFRTLAELRDSVGQHLGHSDWLTIEQDRIDEFARATGDHQWIHVDPSRAADGPFGATIAHGWLSASLLPVLTKQIYSVDATMAINYGVNKLRFPAPVRVGSSVRAGSTLIDVSEQGDAVQLIVRTEIAVKDAAKPALAAETVGRYYLREAQ